MLRTIRNVVLYRLIGGRLMLGLALLGLARKLLGRRRASTNSSLAEPSVDARSAYQPSQGESQIVQREPR